MITWLLSRLKHATSGLWYALRHDKSFRFQIYFILTLGIASRFVLRGLTNYEYTLLAIAAALVIITELQNSALEAALDRLHPELHEDIRRSKDMAAGAVLLAGLVLLLVVVFVILNHFTGV